MTDNSKTSQLNDHNSWLIQKRQKLIGNHDFVPASYLHLAHFWGYITDKEFKAGKKYGKLRGLLDQAQGNYVVWSHNLCLNKYSRASLSPEKEATIEEAWKKVRNSITLQQMVQLDWLIHESVSYNWEPAALQHRLKIYTYVLKEL